MSYNTKNYTKQGGEETHFGGKVVFEDGCVIEGLPSSPIAHATAETLGGIKVGSGLAVTEQGVLSVPVGTAEAPGRLQVGSGLSVAEGIVSANIPDAGADVKGLVKQGAAVAEAEGANPTAAEFKALLDSLKAAGVIASA